ncbi:biotin--[acetyl-CoA-carboxylase] ligase [Myxococcota bacterium]|nr:biotin--[acetyl-CoA-carboxylase] ligase [Myxococcota bacterium]MBU1412882.1 biotin--[acetyl-CoA-carboxylase] ligase [Myxococcota bacterium]MBU1508753.1 biotin--[acetyl-CoA-carboxylase] ligase [Myxococcota bacterium]
MHEWNHPFQFLPVADSTSAILKAFVQKDQFIPGAVAAREQTAGRGRGDNVWQSPPGGLYLSVALPVPDAALLPLIGPGIACDVARWLNERFAVDARIKWPNDWLVGDRKLGGLLMELVRSPQGSLVVVAGIGLNVFHAPTLPGRRAFLPTALHEWADLTGQDLVLLARELAGIVGQSASVHASMEPRLRAFLVGHSATLGREVTVDLPGGERVTGVAEGFAPDFSLLVKTADRIVRVAAGDCFHEPVPG